MAARDAYGKKLQALYEALAMNNAKVRSDPQLASFKLILCAYMSDLSHTSCCPQISAESVKT
jgi:hypothetical protein